MKKAINNYGLIGGFFGVLFGSIFSSWFIIYFNFFTYSMDCIVLSTYFITGFFLLGSILGLVIKTSLSLLVREKENDERPPRFGLWWLNIYLALPLTIISLIAYIEINRPFEYKGLLTIVILCFLLFLILIISRLLSSLILKYLPFSIHRLKMLCAVIFVLMLLFNIGGIIITQFTKSKPKITQTGFNCVSKNKLAIIGVDGATWEIINKLCRENKLPNIMKLMKRGTSADLMAKTSFLNPFANTSSRGIRSPSAWTTIATGRDSRDHGIHDFLKTKIPGIRKYIPFRIPFTTNIGSVKGKISLYTQRFSSMDRNKLAIWDIVNLVGLRAGVINWWITWPPSALNGFMISDRFLEENATNAWYPSDIYESQPDRYLNECGLAINDILGDKWFLGGPKKTKETSLVNKQNNERFEEFYKDIRRDVYVYETACALLRKEIKPELFMLYFKATDTVGHLFWKYVDSTHFGIDINKDENAIYRNIISGTYGTIDKWIGHIVELLGDDYVVIICSDHGMGPWNTKGGLLGGASYWPLNSGNHREKGVLIMSGGPIKSGATMKEAKQNDLFPTALAILGIPIPEDIKGEALREAFTEPESIGIKRKIRTYEKYLGIRKIFEKESPVIDSEYLKRLETLGYIGKKRSEKK